MQLLAIMIAAGALAQSTPTPPMVVLYPCTSAPVAGTVNGGGHFAVVESNTTCTIQAQLTGQAPWCLSRDTTQNIFLHTASWSASEKIGGWLLAGDAGKNSFVAPGSAPAACLSAGANTVVLSAVCADTDASQLWLVDTVNALIRLAADSTTCLGWGDVGGGSGVFVVDTSSAGLRQVVEGVQVELQSDSIGSDNSGLPEEHSGVPHDLTTSERTRFATEVLAGARTIRLAMGLYLRGLTTSRANIVGRWPTQMAELLQLQQESGIEGWAPEYWSPPPAWKDNHQYIGGGLDGFNASFLDAFGDAVVADLQYLVNSGLHVRWWGLQNEPNYDSDNVTCPPDTAQGLSTPLPAPRRVSLPPDTYSTCTYSACQYYEAFKAVAPKVRKWGNGTLRVHANSWSGQLGASPVANDPAALAFVDAWTWHHVDDDSSATFGNNTGPSANTFGKLVYTNEMEYQPGSEYAGTALGTVNSVNMFLNSLTFSNAPLGVISLHASKPVENAESLGYGWTWWRPPTYLNHSVFPSLAPGCFTLNNWNWPAVAPFIKLLPWNSVRRNVLEDVQRIGQRVVVFETPAAGLGGPLHRGTTPGKLIVVLTNQDTVANFIATVGFSGPTVARIFAGYRFAGSADGSLFNVSLGLTSEGPSFDSTLPPLTVEWWLEQ